MWKITQGNKKFKKAIKSKNPTNKQSDKKDNMEGAWGVVSFVFTKKEYTIVSLFDNQESADNYVDNTHIAGMGLMAVPVHLAGTNIIKCITCTIPRYKKDVEYYVTMRSTYGNKPEFRALALWESKTDAEKIASFTQNINAPSELIYTYIGGPVALKTTD
jgi:hypothetical protein